MYKISIPTPCFQSWEQMTPDGNGRYCGSCSKTVVDFSVMSDEEVQRYFTDNYGRQLCGHFKKTQLQRIVIALPQNIFRLQLPFWKKFLVILLLSYGGSFMGMDTSFASNSTFTQGEPVAAYISWNKQHGKNKKHKRKTARKRKKYALKQWEKPDYTIFTVQGYTTINPELPPVCLTPDSLTESPSGKKDSGVTYIEKAASTDNRSPEPSNPVPVKNEIILPAGIGTKRSVFRKR